MYDIYHASSVHICRELIALAQRGVLKCGVFLASMDTNNIFRADMKVETVLQKWPQTWVVFKTQKTDCIGCFMQRFCTLQEVADTYQLKIRDLINELETCVKQSK